MQPTRWGKPGEGLGLRTGGERQKGRGPSRTPALACVLSTGTPRVAADDSAMHNASRYGSLSSRHFPRLQKLTLRLPPSPRRCTLRTHRRPPHRRGDPFASALEPTAFSPPWVGQPL